MRITLEKNNLLAASNPCGLLKTGDTFEVVDTNRIVTLKK